MTYRLTHDSLMTMQLCALLSATAAFEPTFPMSHTLRKSPSRGVTVNQGATELLATMGLEDRMPGRADLDNKNALNPVACPPWWLPVLLMQLQQAPIVQAQLPLPLPPGVPPASLPPPALSPLSPPTWPSSLSTTLPTDVAAYDKARASFNCMVTARPTVIVYPETTEQVQESILMGIRTGSGGMCVRACGHSYSGFSSCDGVLIDVTRLNKVTVGAGGLVTVGAGVTTGEALDAMLPYGVTLPTGTHRDVCMAGLTLGGGYGLLARALGLLCDSLVSITWVRVPFPRYAHTPVHIYCTTAFESLHGSRSTGRMGRHCSQHHRRRRVVGHQGWRRWFRRHYIAHVRDATHRRSGRADSQLALHCTQGCHIDLASPDEQRNFGIHLGALSRLGGHL